MRPNQAVSVVACSVCLNFCFAIQSGAADICTKWRMPSDRTIYQNNGYRLFFAVDGNQDHGIRGSVEGHRGTNLRGLFEGHINPAKEKIVFTVHWSNGAVGGYEGTISQQGRVEGFTYDKNVRGSNADFRAERLLNCVKWGSTAPSTPAPESSSGPGAKPDATKGQQDSSKPDEVLTPEQSTGPSPFTPPKPYDAEMRDVGKAITPPSGIMPAPRHGTDFGDDDKEPR
jgi:hypothetical protein